MKNKTHSLSATLGKFIKQETFKRSLFLALGENCLSDGILERYGLKSFATPYSHGRSNIDYVLELEKSEYAGLLDEETLCYANEKGLPAHAVRSNAIKECDNIFFEAQRKGFEFTHHDVIGNREHRDSIQRKIDRMNELRSSHKYRAFFLYHYRLCPEMDLEALFLKMEEFLNLYDDSSGRNAVAIVFFQRIIENEKQRTVTKSRINDRLYSYEFHTVKPWKGGDQNLFWAKADDDLIEIMIDDIKRIASKKSI